MRLKSFYIFVFVVLFSHLCLAQVYPIQLSAQLATPINPYINEYALPQNEQLKLIVVLNDFDKPQYNIKLKINIEGPNGINIKSLDYYYSQTISLTPGFPELITGSDLAGLLNANNLSFSGISKVQYQNQPVLPEGFYRFCFTAYDATNAQQIAVSNVACAQGWLALNEPPFLNMPFCGNTITPTFPQQISFSWASMNIGAGIDALNTEYVFELWEIRPNNNNPNTIVQSTNPIFSVTTQQSFLNYTLAEPPLNIGMSYAWRVRAKDVNNKALFKNNGYSQVCNFTYGNVQELLANNLEINLNAQGTTSRQIALNWNTFSDFSKYEINYRKTGNPNYNWFIYKPTGGSFKVNNLEANTEYEFKIRGLINGETPANWSNLAIATTKPIVEVQCNELPPPPPDLSNSKPLLAALPGMILQIGQFDLTTTRIYPSPNGVGWYSGYGKVTTPFLGAMLNVEYRNIFVDENQRVLIGVVNAISEGIDKWESNWVSEQADKEAQYIEPGTIDSAYVNGTQACITTSESNTPQCFDFPADGGPITLRDGEGNQVFIYPNGTVKKSGFLTASTDALNATNQKAIFAPHPEQNFGFDSYQYAAWIKNYELIKLADSTNYFVPYISVGSNQNSKVIASLSIASFTAANLSFVTKNNVALSATAIDSTHYQVTIPANAQCVYALYNGNKIGKLNVVELPALTRKVVLVPVNNATVAQSNLQTELNTIFKQANVNFTLTQKANFNFDLGADGLEVADATLMKKYSAEMRALRSAYMQADTAYDKTANYLFVVPNFSNNAMLGYMPRGKAVGFVAANASTKEIAHELAHGAFGLEHTFNAIAQNTTNNLLDYGTGSNLNQQQWLAISTGSSSFNWFDEEEDAALIDARKLVLETLNKIKTAHQLNTTIQSNVLPKPGVYRIEKAVLAGITYDFIQLEVLTAKTSITPQNKITNIQATNMWGSQLFGLDVDAKVKVFVPQNRVANMQIFLTSPADRNLLLFVNGYIIDQEMVRGEDVVYQSDVWAYWKGIDADFTNRITTKNVIYASGNHYIWTSNHKDHLKFALSLQSRLSLVPIQNTEPNLAGFNIRKSCGEKAGLDMITKLYNGTIPCRKTVINNKVVILDTLDVVCHSMGFAYAQGMISEIQKAGIKVGRYYIIAPENPSAGTLPSNIDEAWQYGSDETKSIYIQDGVAPQTKVNGIDGLGANGGRVYIPSTDINTNIATSFLENHSVKNYKWILKLTTDGKVNQRN